MYNTKDEDRKIGKEKPFKKQYDIGELDRRQSEQESTRQERTKDEEKDTSKNKNDRNN